MRTIYWDRMLPILLQVLFSSLAFTCVATIVGMFIMKYFVRKASLFSLGIICFWSIFRVLLVVIVFPSDPAAFSQPFFIRFVFIC